MRSIHYQLICTTDRTWDPKTGPLGRGSKNPDHFVGPRPPRFHGETIRVPRQRELPQLLEINERSPGNSMRFAPRVDGLFRPEEKHGRSSMNDIVPPMRCGNGEVRDIWLRNRLIFPDFKR